MQATAEALRMLDAAQQIREARSGAQQQHPQQQAEGATSRRLADETLEVGLQLLRSASAW